MNPLVSVLIPCHNAERWIEQAITSALNQAYDNTEVIVVDDGSTDNSLEVIKTFDDYIYWETSINRGGNPTRNRLLEMSNGEWLQYLDSDDYLLPNKIAHQVKFLQQNVDADVVFSPIILQHHNRIVESILKEREPNLLALPKVLNLESADAIAQEILPIPEPHDPWILLARWYLPQTGSPLWRKEAIVDVGGWKEDQPCCQEHELYLRLLQGGRKFSYFGQAGSVYRQWSEFTVCKTNKAETYHRRLEIIDQIEEYLRTTQQLSEPRQDAINQARFECARIIWLTDKHWAKAIINQIRQTEINFIPSGNYAPRIYRLLYQVLGFNLAENLAQLKRQLILN
ncbi:glycosyltransferase [Pleurocapsa sp. PCC 7319]|uniref:glycosyltransferase family 2 protein n=1 Tax=Pleurocapsa sp. PCC 7319 TaxID=118161 RepID=UPI000348035F|nr:glycosyltransferase [Pleurocapsa sp. PCC 7319]